MVSSDLKTTKKRQKWECWKVDFFGFWTTVLKSIVIFKVRKWRDIFLLSCLATKGHSLDGNRFHQTATLWWSGTGPPIYQDLFSSATIVFGDTKQAGNQVSNHCTIHNTFFTNSMIYSRLPLSSPDSCIQVQDVLDLSEFFFSYFFSYSSLQVGWAEFFRWSCNNSIFIFK